MVGIETGDRGVAVNKMNRWMVLGLLSMTVALPALAFEYNSIVPAGPGTEGIGDHYRWQGDRPGEGFYTLASRLDLSKEQTEKLRDLRRRQINETGPLRNELVQKRLEMRRLFADPTKDEAAILAKQREIEIIMQKLHEKTTQFRLEQRRVLTPEQLRQLNEIVINRGFGRCGD